MLVLKLFTLLFTIDTERINSLCMWKGDCLTHEKVIASVCKKVIASVHEKAITSVDLGADRQRGSTVNFHFCVKRQSPLLILGEGGRIHRGDQQSLHMKRWSPCVWKGDCLCTWKDDHLCTWKGNCLCWSWQGMDWQSTVNFHHFSCTIQKI